MASSAEVAILMKIAELAKRCGLKASDVDGSLYFVEEENDPEGKGYFALDFGGWPSEAEVYEKSQRFRDLLGGFKSSVLKVAELGDLEEIVDRGLSLAPRARSM